MAPASSLVVRLQIAPPPYTHSHVHSHLVRGRGFGRSAPPVPGHVPPSWSLTTSTVCSVSALAGLLHPAAGPGVRALSGFGHMSQRKRWIVSPTIPDAHEPFEVSLGDSRTVSPRPLPPCRYTLSPIGRTNRTAGQVLEPPRCSSLSAATTPTCRGARRRPTEVDRMTRTPARGPVETGSRVTRRLTCNLLPRTGWFQAISSRESGVLDCGALLRCRG
jgi:hypothetical protein